VCPHRTAGDSGANMWIWVWIGLVWLALAVALSIGIGMTIHTGDKHDALSRRRHESSQDELSQDELQ
jgi:hypothetical protein